MRLSASRSPRRLASACASAPSLIPLIITDPLTLAKQAATLDVYSEGRLELGIGAGWLVEEAQALGRPTDHRLGRLEETIEILRLAWSHETFSYQGRYWSFPEVGVNPRPVAQRKRFICTPGSSPSHAERMTPLRAA